MSGNIANANATFGTATDSAKQTMDTAKAYNDNAQSTLKSVTGAQMPLMNSVSKTAQDNLSNYGANFLQLQQQQAKQAQDYTSDANVQAQRGMAIADTSAGFDAQRRNSQAALAAEGVDPGSIHGAALDSQSRVQQAAAEGQAGTQAYQRTMDTGRQMVAQANQLGLQIAGLGNSGASDASNIGNSIVGNTNSTNATGINNMTASNTFLNTANTANANAEHAQNDQFNDQLGAFNAQQSAQNSTLSSLGSIAGAAAMFMEEGGPVPSGIPYASPYVGGGPVTNRGALAQSPIPGSTDTKPAWLTPGEFVIPKDVTSHKGHEFFHRLIDKTREEISQRHGIPPAHASAHMAPGV